jgi:formate dehydrogenase maturation protein FdhE
MPARTFVRLKCTGCDTKSERAVEQRLEDEKTDGGTVCGDCGAYLAVLGTESRQVED